MRGKIRYPLPLSIIINRHHRHIRFRLPLFMLSTNKFKAKALSRLRGWYLLPDEVVRLIATHYLLSTSGGYSLSLGCSEWVRQGGFDFETYIPLAFRGSSPLEISQRTVYTALRDANGMQRLMRVCRKWSKACEFLFFSQVSRNGCLIWLISSGISSILDARLHGARPFRDGASCGSASFTC